MQFACLNWLGIFHMCCRNANSNHHWDNHCTRGNVETFFILFRFNLFIYTLEANYSGTWRFDIENQVRSRTNGIIIILFNKWDRIDWREDLHSLQNGYVHRPTHKTLIFSRKRDSKCWILGKFKIFMKIVGSWMDPKSTQKCMYVYPILYMPHIRQYTQTVFACYRKTVNRQSAVSKWMRSIIKFSFSGGRFMHLVPFARVWISLFIEVFMRTFVKERRLIRIKRVLIQRRKNGLTKGFKWRFFGWNIFSWTGQNMTIKMWFYETENCS